MNQVDGTECANPACRHRDEQIPERSKCRHCSSNLHSPDLGCSIASVDGDGKVECLPQIACKKWTDDRSLECSQRSDDDCPVDASDSCQIEKATRKRPLHFLDSDDHKDMHRKFTKVAKLNTTPIETENSDGSVMSQPKEKNSAKRGPKHGQKRNEHTNSFWHSLCLQYESIHPKMDVKKFLDSSLSGVDIVDNKSNRQSFKRYLNRFQNGTLIPELCMRKKIAVYPEMEEKLVTFLRKWQERFPREQIGIPRLREKLMQWKKEMPDQEKYSSFKASHAFIEKCLARNNLPRITQTSGFVARFESGLSELHQIFTEMEKVLRTKKGDGVDFEEKKKQKEAHGPAPTLAHQQAMEMVQSLLRHASQNNFSEESVQGVQKYAEELNRRMNNSFSL